MQKSFSYQLSKARKLSNEPTDDPKIPFKKKYEAREILKQLEEQYTDQRGELGTIQTELGKNYQECEETYEGRTYLEKAVETLSDKDAPEDELVCFDDEYVTSLCDAMNYLGIVWMSFSEIEKALGYLEKVDKAYDKYDSVIQDPEKIQQMDNMKTQTCFYLAQIYGSQKNVHLAGKYSFLTLKRQLRSKFQLNTVEWVTHCLQLSGYFVAQDDFSMAEHCLVIAQQQCPLGEDVESTANLYLQWAAFFSAKLDYSYRFIVEWRLEQDKKENTTKYTDKDLFPEDPIAIPSKSKYRDFRFDGIPFNDNHFVVISYKEALSMFKKAKKFYEKALKHYILEGFVTEHVRILQELSNSYRVLTFYEPDLKRKFSMNGRRAKLLIPVVDELNPNIYVNMLKSLTFEIGQVYANMSEIQDSMISDPNCKSPTNEEYNEVILQGITYFGRFIKLFWKDEKVQVEEENHSVFLRAHFSLGSLYFKVKTRERDVAAKFLTLSYGEFQTVVKFAAENKINGMDSEIRIAKDMVELLPQKLQMI